MRRSVAPLNAPEVPGQALVEAAAEAAVEHLVRRQAVHRPQAPQGVPVAEALPVEVSPAGAAVDVVPPKVPSVVEADPVDGAASLVAPSAKSTNSREHPASAGYKSPTAVVRNCGFVRALRSPIWLNASTSTQPHWSR